MHIAVIVTTYNRPDALAAIFESYLAQTDCDFEIVIADDGSTPETTSVIKKYQARASFKISHVWQEDRGFRAAAARNRALAEIDARYVIFTDGDCVPMPDFVAQHRQLAELGWFVTGNRVLLSSGFTKKVLKDTLPIYNWSWLQWLAIWAKRDINRLLPLLRLGDGQWRKHEPQRWRGAKTCNLAVWRTDLLQVNGFDESYSGWGLEDSDLIIRLLHSDICHKNGRFATPLFHLWHSENDRSLLSENQRRLNDLLASDCFLADRGLNQYL